MTRLDLLKILIGQARINGFDFRYWYTGCLRVPWEGQNAAFEIVADQRRYYALLFNHDFARAFWKAGEPITFQVPAQSFERHMADGSIRTIHRKTFMRRSGRPDAWRYHLREMALAEEPLRYMRKYLRVEEELVEDPDAVIDMSAAAQPKPPPEPAPRPALITLSLARKAAARRQSAVDKLPANPVKPSAKRRTPRLPGSR